MTTTDDFGVLVSAATGGYRWFVYDESTNHVFAQGFAKQNKTAIRQANEALLLLRADLWQGGVLT